METNRRTGSQLLIVEEQDVNAAKELGFAATNSKSWRPDSADRGRSGEVVVITRTDTAGRRLAEGIARQLTGKVRSLKVFELPGSKGLSEWINAGGTRDALSGFIENQPEWSPELAWRWVFHTFEDFEKAPPLRFAIRDFLQLDGATLIGGLSGHGKTLIMLSLAKALLSGGKKLWNEFDVLETAQRVVYLIPESVIGPFGYRLKLFGLFEYLKDDRLLVRTLSMGPTPCLSDPRILAAAKDAHVMLDTAVRFSSDGDENSAADNQRGLASDIFALLGAGAKSVIGAHHSPKPFAKENVMRLENVLRGSGDIGAMVSTAWGIKQLDASENIIHVENVKPRDFEPPRPFQIIGRPFIDEEGDFRILKRPGECGSLQDEQQPDRDKGGAPVQAREARAANIELLRRFLQDDPKATSESLAARFSEAGISVSPVTVRKYRAQITR